jgi:hypothetical protein
VSCECAERNKDFDETRRLIYMALAAAKTEKYNVVGPLTNALLHHSKLAAEIPVDELIDRLVSVVEVGNDHHDWLDELLHKLEG